MAVPGSSPVVVIDADEDSGFTASVDSKLANEYYLYMLVLKIISSPHHLIISSSGHQKGFR